MAGSLGDAAAFSFYPTKNLGAFGDAGAILSSDARIAERASQLRQYGWKEKYHTITPGGRNSHMDPLQAIVLSLELKHLAKWNKQRQKIRRVNARRLPPAWSLVYRDSENFVAILPWPSHRINRRLAPGGTSFDGETLAVTKSVGVIAVELQEAWK